MRIDSIDAAYKVTGVLGEEDRAMRPLMYLAAALIGQANPATAQEPLIFSLDEALETSMAIGQAWPEDLSALRDVLQGDRIVAWMNLAELSATPPIEIESDDPWYGTTSEIGMTDAIGLLCVRIGQLRLAEMRAMEAAIADPGGVDVQAVVARANALVPHPDPLENHAIQKEWDAVPPEAVAAQFCILTFPVENGATDPAPDMLAGLFDTVAPAPPEERPPFGVVPPFDGGSVASGWRGPGPSGGITLLWSDPMAAPGQPSPMMFVMATSWLAP